MTISTTMVNKLLKSAAVLLFWLAIWQLAAIIISSEIIVPTPLATLKALIELSKTAGFYYAVLTSLLRITIGFILGVLVGFLGALMSYKSRIFSVVAAPALKVIKAVPVASFIILAFYWFKSDVLPIFICFLMVLPMIWSAVETGLKGIDNKYIELARVYRLDGFKTFFQIKLPFIMPSFISTALTALGVAWKSGIAAEVICRPTISLGSMLQDAKIYISTPEVFAVTCVVAVLSIILEASVKYVIRRFYDDKVK